MIAVITALLAAVLFVFAAIAVDVGRWYSEGERLQRTVDAAALAGAPYLPGDLGKARDAARASAVQNGYDASVPDSAITIADRPSRLQVTLSSTIPNAFGTIVGARFQTVTRSAVADFAASSITGSPCNVLGNDPKDTGGNLYKSGSCPEDPSFWNGIAGPESSKESGDRFATRSCAAGNSNCLGSRNLDYSGGPGIVGQSYYVYRISARKPISSMTLQAFDPGFVDVGDHCSEPGKLEQTADGSWSLGPTTIAPDAAERYAWGDPSTTPATTGAFCTGDSLLNRPSDPAKAAAEASKLNTSFLVLNPTDTQDPMKSTPACPPQSFGGFSGDLTKALVSSADPGYNIVARSFRQWVDLCRISYPVKERDYYLIVRTNVPFGASAARMLNPAEDPAAGGDGLNRFGLRVGVGGGSLSDVSISALDRLPVHATLKGGTTTEFYLSRVTSAHAGGLLTVTLFDVGDSPDTPGQKGTIQVKDPWRSPPSGCKATGEVTTFLSSGCKLTSITASAYHGKVQRIQVPIPADYSCDDADPTSCWYLLHLSGYSSPMVIDTMTWSASLDGDPVRLVK